MTQPTYTEYQAKQKSLYARPEVGQTVSTFAPNTSSGRVVKSSVTSTEYYPVKAVVTKVTESSFFATVTESSDSEVPVGYEFRTQIVKANVVVPNRRNKKSTCHWTVV